MAVGVQEKPVLLSITLPANKPGVPYDRKPSGGMAIFRFL